MAISQGDIYWVELEEPRGSEPAYRHPHVVIQNNLFNFSNINTVVVCALTTNLKRASCPDNIILRKNEAGLPKKSVINITQIITVNKSDLKEKIGQLSMNRIKEILEGLNILFRPKDISL
ncbi:MAG: type II toxin-antitoxin system PemK/MazF family toxin [Candidatus Aminicenantes bacterium]|nr:type II toxin-antitoxin system PemK/MazF family toxin [Candidatus Aminicenantes bacterium]